MWSQRLRTVTFTPVLPYPEGQAKRATQAWCLKLALVGSVDCGFWTTLHAGRGSLAPSCGRPGWTMHPGRTARLEFIASLHSTLGGPSRLNSLGGDPGVRGLKVGFRFFPSVFLRTGTRDL